MLRPGKIDYGSTVRLDVTWSDQDGTPFDPGTVTLQTYGPNGVTASYTHGVDAGLLNTAVGVYEIDVTADQTGRWSYRWGAKDGTTTLYREGKFNVQRSEWYDDISRGYYR